MKKLIFLQLNEVNFHILEKYFIHKNFNNFEKIISQIKKTDSEKIYEFLEPWIQWYSIHTGKSAEEHKVFRLGDCKDTSHENIFEILMKKNKKVGAICPMNIFNNNSKYRYFIPDPWTNSPTDGSWWSNLLNMVLKKTVNNNANNNINLKTLFQLGLVFLKFARIKNYMFYFKYALTSSKFKWRKSLLLDLLLHDIHIYFLNKNPDMDFSTLFLNSCAHIQHHYLLNSLENNKYDLNPNFILSPKQDPVKEVFELYNLILGDYLNKKDFELLLATGLSQKIVKDKNFYWRLKNHNNFFKKLNIEFKYVMPRMSRDFLLEFDEKKTRDLTYDELSKVYINNEKLFGIIDKRKNSIFVSLTYNKLISRDDLITFKNNKLNASEELSFVALKNGEHDSKGYIYSSSNKIKDEIYDGMNVKNMFNILINYFKFNV